MVGADVATVSTLALFGIGALPAGTQSSLVIAAGITVLLSGLSVVGTVQDAISGFYVTAAGRAAEVALLSAGLLTGVILGFQSGLGFQAHPGPGRTGGRRVARSSWLCAFAAATAAAMYALATYAPIRSLLAAGLAGGIGWAVYGALTLFAHLGPVVSTGRGGDVRGHRHRRSRLSRMTCSKNTRPEIGRSRTWVRENSACRTEMS